MNRYDDNLCDDCGNDNGFTPFFITHSGKHVCTACAKAYEEFDHADDYYEEPGDLDEPYSMSHRGVTEV
jgi:hypothetical protein